MYTELMGSVDESGYSG